MQNIATIIHCLFPIIALVLLVIGFKRNALYYVISALWLSLIGLITNYQASGGEILGSYFNYVNTLIYSLNLLILLIALLRIITDLGKENPNFKYTASFLQSLLAIGSLLVLINIWTNAYFIENRMIGTPVMQVALLDKSAYCSYRYLFYKVDTDGSVVYLCPNHYGLIPSIGRLSISPDFIANQLSEPSKKQMLLLQQKKN